MSALDYETEAELEHDMPAGEAMDMAAAAFGGDDNILDDEEDCACCVEETGAEDGGCYDEEDPLAAPAETEAEEGEDEEEDEEDEEAGAAEAGAGQEGSPSEAAELQEGTPPAKKKKKKARSSKKGAAATRLEELARPRPPRAETAAERPKPVEKPEKKPPTTRPSLLLRLRPTNLEEAMEAFFKSDFSEAPQFTYAFPEDYVTKHFEENSNVCFELLPEAQRILQKVQDEHGGPECFMQKLYGEEKVSAEDLRDMVAAYLQDHNIEDKVEIRIVDNMLAAANVVKPSPDEKYVVNIARGPISKNMVQGICDHEVGTHLLRMMNDEYQVWHGRRDRYRLLNPWTTEEGFATLNTYISMPSKLLYPQALRYFAVCRGAQVGFVELFRELREHVSDPKRCWQMCCRIKRGMIDTSQPGAFYMDQAYFKGAVEILRHLNEIDFGRLYGGQIALQDMDKVHFLLRKEVVRLPRFLNTPEKLKTYLAHCRKLIKENQIEAAVERVCKPVFIRAAKEFFKKPKQELRATIAIGAPGPHVPGADGAKAGGRTLDLSRLEDLARPRPVAAAEVDVPEAGAKRRDLDVSRLAELAMPRARAESEEPSGNANGAGRAPDLARLVDLARPRQLPLLSGPNTDGAEGGAARREFSRTRMLELAAPRPRVNNEGSAAEGPAAPPKPRASQCRGASAPPPSTNADARSDDDAESAGESGDDEATAAPASRKARRRRRRSRTKDPPPPPPPPSFDATRLATLAQPRKACEEEQNGQPCLCAPKTRKKRRRTKLRLLALVQERQEQMKDEEGEDESPLEPSPRDGSSTPGVQEEMDETILPPTEVSAIGGSAELRLAEVAAPLTTTSSPASSAVALAQELKEPVRDSKPRSDASRRAQSLGPRAVAADMPETWQPMSFGSGGTPPPLPGTGAARGLGRAGMTDPILGVPIARKPRTTTSLPRPSAILPRAGMAAMATVASSNSDGPAWKAVPIKTMQLQLAL